MNKVKRVSDGKIFTVENNSAQDGNLTTGDYTAYASSGDGESVLLLCNDRDNTVVKTGFLGGNHAFVVVKS